MSGIIPLQCRMVHVLLMSASLVAEIGVGWVAAGKGFALGKDLVRQQRLTSLPIASLK